ncbi:MAG: hypothetical protein GQ552_03440 [Flavobacteriaceae bacterium]|nr:hypothetical protein [Flavobacteriaceae bacterium]
MQLKSSHKKKKTFADSPVSVLKESGGLIKPISKQIFTNTIIEAEIFKK